MTPAQVKAAVERIRKEDRWIPIEASGGIVLENIRAYAEDRRRTSSASAR